MARVSTALIRGVLVLAALAFQASQASAIASITVTPSRVRLTAQQPVATTPLTFVWTVTPAPGPLRAISSPGGAFLLDVGGRRVLASTGPLEPLNGGAPPTGPVVFSESIDLPAELLAIAAQAGARRILYSRSFVATYTVQELVPILSGSTILQSVQNRNARTTTEGAVVIDLDVGMGGPLRIFRAQLRFDDGSPLRVIEENTRLRAFADLSYTGGGTIEGVWELADANTTVGTPIFTPLVRVRRFLGAGQRVTIEAPPLPTYLRGKHLVRFRVIEPDAAIEDPVIAYSVVTRAVSPRVARMTTRGPGAHAQLGPDTLFEWDPVPGAAAYQIELLDRQPDTPLPLFSDQGQVFRDVRSPGAERLPYERASATETVAGERSDDRAIPVAGTMLTPDRLESELNVVTLGHVEMGSLYLWRVRALAADGSTIGLSPSRPVRAPGAPLAPVDAPPPSEQPGPAEPPTR